MKKLLNRILLFMVSGILKIEGYPGELKPENFTAVALYSDMKPTGTFTSSNPLINQLQHNIQWGQRGNFLDVPTDCPQRDERLGWTGDAQVFSRTASFNMNVNNFFAKWLKDVAADQLAEWQCSFCYSKCFGRKCRRFNRLGRCVLPSFHGICTWLMAIKKFLEHQYNSMKAWVSI